MGDEMIIFDADDPLVLDGTYDREGYKPGERARIAKARTGQLKGPTMPKGKRGRASRIDRKLAKPDAPGRPRDRDLPGLEDRAIRELEDLAADYAELRDRRLEIGAEESQCKGRLMAVMHKLQRTSYQRNGIKIWLEPGEEEVKVRVKKPKDDETPAEDVETQEQA